MPSIWKGSISFGLVNIPVRLYPATREQRIRFRQLHRGCAWPIRYEKICSRCEEVVAKEDIVKGFPLGKDEYVILQEEELEAVDLPTTRTIHILDFVDLFEVDPLYYHKSYYLQPTTGGEKAYYLLEQVLKEQSRVALGRVVLRTKEHLILLRPLTGRLTLSLLYYPHEVMDVETVELGDREQEILPREEELASQLVSSLSTNFDPSRYRDRYRDSLMEIIQGKLEGEEIARPRPSEEKGIRNLMEALEASLKQEREQREEQKIHGPL